MRLYQFIFLTLALLQAYPYSLKESFKEGKIGDYIVTTQGELYTTLLIRNLSISSVTIEEITVPKGEINLSKINWKTWIESRAPGHTSWTAYAIDLQSDKLLESYSYSTKAWLYTDDPSNFLARLLSLPIEKTAQDLRRRIGPAPAIGEEDHRSFWNPPVCIEGKSLPTPLLTAYTGKWPSDGSVISACEVELYFLKNFPFPYWIDVKSTHYKAAIRSVDSGHDLSSPMPPLPQRSPEFLGTAKWEKEKVSLSVKCPSYFAKLNLFILDLSPESYAPVFIPCTGIREGENMVLEIPRPFLESILKRGHPYQWLVVPEESTQVMAESKTPFIY